jgi:hypothetical protein
MFDLGRSFLAAVARSPEALAALRLIQNERTSTQ